MKLARQEKKSCRALDKLGNSEGISIWDTFLGGGILGSVLKYSEVSSSDDYVHRTQRELPHFKTELMDVQNVASESFTVNKNDICTFLAIFFDNIFSDWTVHSPITDAKSKLNAVLQDVRKVQNQLARKCIEVSLALDRLEVQNKR